MSSEKPGYYLGSLESVGSKKCGNLCGAVDLQSILTTASLLTLVEGNHAESAHSKTIKPIPTEAIGCLGATGATCIARCDSFRRVADGYRRVFAWDSCGDTGAF